MSKDVTRSLAINITVRTGTAKTQLENFKTDMKNAVASLGGDLAAAMMSGMQQAEGGMRSAFSNLVSAMRTDMANMMRGLTVSGADFGPMAASIGKVATALGGVTNEMAKVGNASSESIRKTKAAARQAAEGTEARQPRKFASFSGGSTTPAGMMGGGAATARDAGTARVAKSKVDFAVAVDMASKAFVKLTESADKVSTALSSAQLRIEQLKAFDEAITEASSKVGVKAVVTPAAKAATRRTDAVALENVMKAVRKEIGAATLIGGGYGFLSGQRPDYGDVDIYAGSETAFKRAVAMMGRKRGSPAESGVGQVVRGNVQGLPVSIYSQLPPAGSGKLVPPESIVWKVTIVDDKIPLAVKNQGEAIAASIKSMASAMEKGLTALSKGIAVSVKDSAKQAKEAGAQASEAASRVVATTTTAKSTGKDMGRLYGSTAMTTITAETLSRIDPAFQGMGLYGRLQTAQARQAYIDSVMPSKGFKPEPIPAPVVPKPIKTPEIPSAAVMEAQLRNLFAKLGAGISFEGLSAQARGGADIAKLKKMVAEGMTLVDRPNAAELTGLSKEKLADIRGELEKMQPLLMTNKEIFKQEYDILQREERTLKANAAQAKQKAKEELALAKEQRTEQAKKLDLALKQVATMKEYQATQSGRSIFAGEDYYSKTPTMKGMGKQSPYGGWGAQVAQQEQSQASFSAALAQLQMLPSQRGGYVVTEATSQLKAQYENEVKLGKEIVEIDKLRIKARNDLALAAIAEGRASEWSMRTARSQAKDAMTSAQADQATGAILTGIASPYSQKMTINELMKYQKEWKTVVREMRQGKVPQDVITSLETYFSKFDKIPSTIANFKRFGEAYTKLISMQQALATGYLRRDKSLTPEAAMEQAAKQMSKTATAITSKETFKNQLPRGMEEMPSILATMRQMPAPLYGQYNAALKEQGILLDGLHGKVQKYFNSVKNYISFQLQWFAGMGAIFSTIGVITDSVRQVLTFKQAMAEVQAITGANEKQMRGFGVAALEVSTTTGYTAEEVGKLGLQLNRAGIDFKDLPPVMMAAAKVARLSGEDLKTVADTLAIIKSAWNLTGDAVMDKANVLVNALNYSRLTIEDFGTSLNYLAGMSALIGKSFDEVAAVMAGLSNMGVRASTIGTGLSQVLGELISPTAKFSEELRRIGLSYDKVDPRLHSYADVLKTLSTSGFDAARSMDILSDRTARSLMFAVKYGGEEFEKMLKRLQEPGKLQKAFEIAMTGPINAMRTLRTAFQNIFQTVLGDASSYLTSLLRGLTELTNAVNTFAGVLLKNQDILMLFMGGFALSRVSKAAAAYKNTAAMQARTFAGPMVSGPGGVPMQMAGKGAGAVAVETLVGTAAFSAATSAISVMGKLAEAFRVARAGAVGLTGVIFGLRGALMSLLAMSWAFIRSPLGIFLATLGIVIGIVAKKWHEVAEANEKAKREMEDSNDAASNAARVYEALSASLFDVEAAATAARAAVEKLKFPSQLSPEGKAFIERSNAETADLIRKMSTGAAAGNEFDRANLNEAMRRAIASVETGKAANPYDVHSTNPKSTAYGKYQFNNETWETAVKAYNAANNTKLNPKEIRGDADWQERIAAHRFETLLAQYGNVTDVFGIHHLGEGGWKVAKARGWESLPANENVWENESGTASVTAGAFRQYMSQALDVFAKRRELAGGSQGKAAADYSSHKRKTEEALSPGGSLYDLFTNVAPRDRVVPREQIIEAFTRQMQSQPLSMLTEDALQRYIVEYRKAIDEQSELAERLIMQELSHTDRMADIYAERTKLLVALQTQARDEELQIYQHKFDMRLITEDELWAQQHETTQRNLQEELKIIDAESDAVEDRFRRLQKAITEDLQKAIVGDTSGLKAEMAWVTQLMNEIDDADMYLALQGESDRLSARAKASGMSLEQTRKLSMQVYENQEQAVNQQIGLATRASSAIHKMKEDDMADEKRRLLKMQEMRKAMLDNEIVMEQAAREKISAIAEYGEQQGLVMLEDAWNKKYVRASEYYSAVRGLQETQFAREYQEMTAQQEEARRKAQLEFDFATPGTVEQARARNALVEMDAKHYNDRLKKHADYGKALLRQELEMANNVELMWDNADYGRIIAKALRDVEAEWQQHGKRLYDLMSGVYQDLAQAFSDIYFDSITGKTKDIGDYFKGVAQKITRSMTDELGRMTMSIPGSILKGILPGKELTKEAAAIKTVNDAFIESLRSVNDTFIAQLKEVMGQGPGAVYTTESYGSDDYYAAAAESSDNVVTAIYDLQAFWEGSDLFQKSENVTPVPWAPTVPPAEAYLAAAMSATGGGGGGGGAMAASPAGIASAPYMKNVLNAVAPGLGMGDYASGAAALYGLATSGGPGILQGGYGFIGNAAYSAVSGVGVDAIGFAGGIEESMAGISSTVDALGSVVGTLGAAVGVAGSLYGLYAAYKSRSPIGGAISGATLGTMILPGIGTAIGAVVGAIVGMLKKGKEKASMTMGYFPDVSGLEYQGPEHYHQGERDWRIMVGEGEQGGFGFGVQGPGSNNIASTQAQSDIIKLFTNTRKTALEALRDMGADISGFFKEWNPFSTTIDEMDSEQFQQTIEKWLTDYMQFATEGATEEWLNRFHKQGEETVETIARLYESFRLIPVVTENIDNTIKALTDESYTAYAQLQEQILGAKEQIKGMAEALEDMTDPSDAQKAADQLKASIMEVYNAQRNAVLSLVQGINDAQKAARQFRLSMLQTINSLRAGADSARVKGEIVSQIGTVYGEFEGGSAQERVNLLGDLESLLGSWVSIGEEEIRARYESANAMSSAAAQQENVIEKWKGLLENIKKTLKDMEYSTDNPQSLAVRTGLAKAEADTLLEQFRAGADKVGTGEKLYDAVMNYLGLAKELYDRPSLEYQGVYDWVRSVLQEMQGTDITKDPALKFAAATASNTAAMEEELKAFRADAAGLYELLLEKGDAAYKELVAGMTTQLHSIIGEQTVEEYLGNLQLATVVELTKVRDILDQIAINTFPAAVANPPTPSSGGGPVTDSLRDSANGGGTLTPGTISGGYLAWSKIGTALLWYANAAFDPAKSSVQGDSGDTKGYVQFGGFKASDEQMLEILKFYGARWVQKNGQNYAYIPEQDMYYPIRAMAQGGLVERPTLSVVGERGPEVVVPLEKLDMLKPELTVHNQFNINITEVQAPNAGRTAATVFVDSFFDALENSPALRHRLGNFVVTRR